MKRIAFLICGLLLVVTNTADARWRRRSNTTNYNTRPAAAVTYAAPVAAAPASTVPAVNGAPAATTGEAATDVATAEHHSAVSGEAAPVVSVSHAAAAEIRTVSYSTATAQGIANLMAAYNRVGHFGGNPGYEGCGCGATPAAAYAICCYANSGMATVDVGYAQGSNGMWFCCRRYR
jgi:hypothetical protein